MRIARLHGRAAMSESYAVAGLHLNGEVAPWDDPTAGGEHED